MFSETRAALVDFMERSGKSQRQISRPGILFCFFFSFHYPSGKQEYQNSMNIKIIGLIIT